MYYSPRSGFYKHCSTIKKRCNLGKSHIHTMKIFTICVYCNPDFLSSPPNSNKPFTSEEKTLYTGDLLLSFVFRQKDVAASKNGLVYLQNKPMFTSCLFGKSTYCWGKAQATTHSKRVLDIPRCKLCGATNVSREYFSATQPLFWTCSLPKKTSMIAV